MFKRISMVIVILCSFSTLLFLQSVFAVGVGDVFNSTEGFSGVQGANNWRYMYVNDDGQYVELTNYKEDTSNPLLSMWYLSDEEQYCLVAPSSIHPDIHDAVRAFIVPASGTVKIDGDIFRGSTNGDGTNFKVMHNDSKVWPESGEWKLIAPGEAVKFNTDLKVQEGDMVYFIVNKNANILSDGLYPFILTITYKDIGDHSSYSDDTTPVLTASESETDQTIIEDTTSSSIESSNDETAASLTPGEDGNDSTSGLLKILLYLVPILVLGLLILWLYKKKKQ